MFVVRLFLSVVERLFVRIVGQVWIEQQSARCVVKPHGVDLRPPLRHGARYFALNHDFVFAFIKRWFPANTTILISNPTWGMASSPPLHLADHSLQPITTAFASRSACP